MARPSKAALRERIYETKGKLAADVDPVTAAAAALDIMLDSAWSFSRHCKRLPPAVIRALLGRAPTNATHVYFTLAVDREDKDAAIVAQWARAIRGLADLEVINRWDSAAKKTKFRALAKNKHLLAAIQGAAANGKDVSDDMLAVLVADGSDDSLDALIPHLGKPGNAYRLDRLRSLRVHAKETPALKALFAELDGDAEKTAASAHEIAGAIGLTKAKVFWFQATIWAQVPEHAISPAQVNVGVDSRKASWLQVDAATVVRGSIGGSSSFTNDQRYADELRLGRCEAVELPGWLVRVAKKLRITWDTPYIRSSVRGAKRDQIARWLVPG